MSGMLDRTPICGVVIGGQQMPKKQAFCSTNRVTCGFLHAAWDLFTGLSTEDGDGGISCRDI